MKFLQIGDVHLGAKLSFLGNKADNHRERIWNTLDESLRLVDSEDIDLIVFTGDIFDSPIVDQSQLTKFKRIIEPVLNQGIQIVLIPGNHDLLIDNGVWTQFERNLENLHIVSDKNGQILDLPDLQTTIACYPISAKKANFSPVDKLIKIIENNRDKWDNSKYRLAATHGALDIWNKGGNYPISETELHKLANLNCHYLALGDWHGKFNQDQKKMPVVYSGSIEILDSKQDNAGHIVIGNILEDGKTTYNYHKISKLEIITKQFNLDQKHPNQIRNEIEDQADKNKLFSAKLIGKTNLKQNSDTINLQSLYDELSDQFYFLEIKDETDLIVTSTDIEDYPKDSIPYQFIKLVEKYHKSGQIEDNIAQSVLQLGIQTIVGNRAGGNGSDK